MNPPGLQSYQANGIVGTAPAPAHDPFPSSYMLNAAPAGQPYAGNPGITLPPIQQSFETNGMINGAHDDTISDMTDAGYEEGPGVDWDGADTVNGDPELWDGGSEYTHNGVRYIVRQGWWVLNDHDHPFPSARAAGAAYSPPIWHAGLHAVPAGHWALPEMVPGPGSQNIPRPETPPSRPVTPPAPPASPESEAVWSAGTQSERGRSPPHDMSNGYSARVHDRRRVCLRARTKSSMVHTIFPAHTWFDSRLVCVYLSPVLRHFLYLLHLTLNLRHISGHISGGASKASMTHLLSPNPF